MILHKQYKLSFLVLNLLKYTEEYLLNYIKITHPLHFCSMPENCLHSFVNEINEKVSREWEWLAIYYTRPGSL